MTPELSTAVGRFGAVLERLRQRLDLLSRGTDKQAIQAKRDRVVCEYLAEYRRLCAEVGPIAYATDLGLQLAWDDGLPTIRTIAYAAASHDMNADCDFIYEAIDAAAKGFEDWQAAEETAKR